ncbi:MAG: protein-L-isoaspartate(D-aspartate) O-methyltransferase [Nitrosomonadales bacterium]|nr:protein-L-isoaspartate(D-aspartate) O-methyltransferase [Nitrosomonadales bacterium]
MVRSLFLSCLLAWAVGALAADEFASSRAELSREVESEIALIAPETGRPAMNPGVLAAMRKVPRHRFVPADQARNAYLNRPLPIGHGQTISQPLIVALMTDLMQLRRGDTVLEIGTGSGYQAAIMGELAKTVYSIEIIEPLARQAAGRLKEQGYANVTVKVGDGYHGWPEHGPFDSIMVTAAASHIPPPLLQQLKPGGRMVIPVGAQFMTQYLMLVEKRADGAITTRQILPVRFVPLTGEH